MTHIEEHILELYVLGSGKVEGRRDEIEEHLRACAMCRSLVNEMRSFYSEAREELNVLKDAKAPDQKALTRAFRESVIVKGRRFNPASINRSTPMGRVRYFVYRHPFVAGGGVFAFGAGAVMALSLLTSSPTKDTNPAYKNYNVLQGRMEILNKNHEKLWELPSQNLQGEVASETQFNTRKTIVTDLDGDGKNEVLTTLLVGAESTPPTCLKVFDANQKLKFQKCFNQHFDYLGRTYYDPQFTTDDFVLNDLDTGKREILLIATNYGRSPCFVVRLDDHCGEIGKYWHFGNIGSMVLFDLDKDGKKELILGGINDTPDTTHEEFPVIMVLDPTKIVGDKKSTSAPGFEFPGSDAELYYVSLPLSDMNIVMNAKSMVRRIDTIRGSAISFFVRSGKTQDHPETEDIQFEYLFARDMSVLEVKSGNVTDRLHALKVQQGKLTGKLDAAYLENLKSGVRYWDGKEWRKDVVKVNHSLLSAGGMSQK